MAFFSKKSDLETLAQQLKKKVKGLLAVYGLLILGTILLFLVILGLCVWGAWVMFDSGYISARAIIVLVGIIVIAGICVVVVLKPIFQIFEPEKPKGKEVYRKDAPELFALIDEVAEKVDCMKPKHVYISDECNAYVNYPSMLGYIFPGAQNLTIGIPLLYGMNKTEFKSILSHEFGHFTQKSVKVNRVANLSEFVCAAINQSREQIEKADTGSYEFQAVLFARLATNIMLKQYHKVASLNGALSRAQEYDADRHSYNVVGTEGCMSALCKIQELSSRWDDNFIPWLWDEISDRRAPESVWSLFNKFSGKLDSFMFSNMKADEHFKPSLGEFDSRISDIENTDTHPSTNQRCLAIASYPLKATNWDDSPAYDLFQESAIQEMFNHVVLTLKDRRFPQTTEFLKKDIKDEELLSRIDGASSSPLMDYFFNDEIFFQKELLEAVETSPTDVDFPFTRESANKIREYITAKNDYNTLCRIVDENASQRRFLYNGKEYNGTNVPIAEHREYYSKKYDLAWTIALKCHSWLKGKIAGDEDEEHCYKDMLWIKQVEIRLGEWIDNMRTVYQIGANHDHSTKATEFVDSMESSFRNLLSRFFEPGKDGSVCFNWLADNTGLSDEMKKLITDFMSKAHRDSEEEFCDVFQYVGSVFEKHHQLNWNMLKAQVIMPEFLTNKEYNS